MCSFVDCVMIINRERFYTHNCLLLLLLLITCDNVDVAVNMLEKIDYDSNKFRQVMESSQNYIDEMSLGGYCTSSRENRHY